MALQAALLITIILNMTSLEPVYMQSVFLHVRIALIQSKSKITFYGIFGAVLINRKFHPRWAKLY